jgi:hypothetical protein
VTRGIRVRIHHRVLLAAVGSVGIGLAACGGSNPLDNPGTVSNPSGGAGQTLSYLYFEKCVNPVFFKALPSPTGSGTNTCGSSGCHAPTGTGGAFRIIASAPVLELSDPANTPAVIRAGDMYKNFYSAQGEVVIGNLSQSRLLNKPLLQNVLHGGNLIFASNTDPNVKLIEYWISNPVPPGQDEFSASTYSMFTPPYPDPTAQCNTN